MQRLRSIVGASLDEAERVRAQGRIERWNGRYRLILKTQVAAADSQREIEAVSCSDLAGAAAVALALLVRDEAATRNSSTSGVSANEQATATEPPAKPASSEPAAERDATKPSAATPEPPREAPPNTSAERTTRFLLRAPLIGLDVGPLPRPSPNLGLAAGVRFDAFELTLGARIALAQTTWVNGVPDYGAELRRVATELRGCYAFRSAELALAPCVLVALDPITASGVGAEVSSQTSTTLVPALGVAAMGSVQLAARWALIASLGLQVQTARPRINVEGLGEVTQLSAFAFSASTGIELSL